MSGPGMGWPVNDLQETASGGSAAWRSSGYRSADTRALAAMIALGVYVALAAGSLVMEFLGFGILDAAANGTLLDADGASYDRLVGLLAIGSFVILVVCAVCVVAWLSRTVDNIPPLTGGTPDRSPRAAIGWWFVPFANYVVPFGITKDAVTRLRPEGGPNIEGLLLPWWLCWVFGNIISNLSIQVPQDTLDGLRSYLTITAFSDVLLIVAGALLIVIIRATQANARLRAATVAQTAPASLLGGTIVSAPPPTVAAAPTLVEQPVETAIADAAGPLAPPPPPQAPPAT